MERLFSAETLIVPIVTSYVQIYLHSLKAIFWLMFKLVLIRTLRVRDFVPCLLAKKEEKLKTVHNCTTAQQL